MRTLISNEVQSISGGTSRIINKNNETPIIIPNLGEPSGRAPSLGGGAGGGSTGSGSFVRPPSEEFF